VRVTRLGFGCEEVRDPDLLRNAAEVGINYFNCFPKRGDISHFTLVGEALRSVRSRVILGTASNRRTRTGLLQDLDRQLVALRTDRIDLFYLVAVSKPETLTDELLGALQTAHASGKIRAAALSTHGFAAVLPRLQECTDTIRAVMVTCNFASWDSGGWSESLKDVRQLRESGVGIVAMKPLMGGMGEAPQGRDNVEAALKSSSGRARVMSAALRWVVQNELVDTVPVLIASRQELDAATDAASRGLNAQDEELLEVALGEARPRLCRLCPSCSAQCRFGVPIPEVMRALMYAQGYQDMERARTTFEELGPAANRIGCDWCPGCTATCPNGVEVRDRMQYAQRLLSPRISTCGNAPS
jgi:predicted aldo/keto reductase-like oxidoreductase